MIDSYALYCQWCLDHGYAKPTREWWDKACAQPRKVVVFEPDFDFDTERREGWTYDA